MEHNDITARLTAIYDIAAQKLDDLRKARIEIYRSDDDDEIKGTALEGNDAERKAARKTAFLEVASMLQDHPTDHLPILAATYFHYAHHRQRQIAAMLESKAAVRKRESAGRERLAMERALRIETKEQLLWAKDLLARQKQARRKGAETLHLEHRAIKKDVFAWLDASSVKFKSNEAAATAIERQAPIAHVTAREWYKEWKKLQSASTP